MKIVIEQVKSVEQPEDEVLFLAEAHVDIVGKDWCFTDIRFSGTPSAVLALLDKFTRLIALDRPVVVREAGQ